MLVPESLLPGSSYQIIYEQHDLLRTCKLIQMLTIVLQPPFGGHHDMSNKWYKCNDMYIRQLYWFSNQVNQSFHFTFKHLESLKTIISLGRSYPVFTTDLKPTGQTMIFKIYDTSPRSKIEKPWNIRKKKQTILKHIWISNSWWTLK